MQHRDGKGNVIQKGNKCHCLKTIWYNFRGNCWMDELPINSHLFVREGEVIEINEWVWDGTFVAVKGNLAMEMDDSELIFFEKIAG